MSSHHDRRVQATGRLLLWGAMFLLAAMLLGLGACVHVEGPGIDQPSLLLTPWRQWWRPALPPQAYGAGEGVAFKIFQATGEEVALLQGGPVAPAVLETKTLPDLPPGRYRLSFDLYRPGFVNSHYVTVDLFGRRTWLDNHCRAGGWQPFVVEARLAAGQERLIAFLSDSDSLFLLRNPVLTRVPEPAAPEAVQPARPKHRLPIGVYGATPNKLEEIAACGFNTVYLSGPAESAPQHLAQAARLGLEVIQTMPREPQAAMKLVESLAGLPSAHRPLYFYLVDEPEIRSYPIDKIVGIRRQTQARLPWARFATAVVRPWLIPQYTAGYDALFMDQYPVPSQPLSWLAESVGQARDLARPGTSVWAVVQAFGGGKFAAMGWPRLPTIQETRTLAVSALTQGAEGLMFYSWRYLSGDENFRRDLCRLTGQLRRLAPYAPLTPGLPPGYEARPIWRVRGESGGGEAVVFGWARGQDGALVIAAANVTRFDARWSLSLPEGRTTQLEDLWRGGRVWAARGEVVERFEPMGVRVWLVPPAAPGADR